MKILTNPLQRANIGCAEVPTRIDHHRSAAECGTANACNIGRCLRSPRADADCVRFPVDSLVADVGCERSVNFVSRSRVSLTPAIAVRDRGYSNNR